MGCLWRRRSTAGLPLCPDTLTLLLYLLLSFRGGGRGCESRQLNISSHISHTHSLHPSSKQRCSCFMPLLCPPPSCPLSRSLCVTCSTPRENPPKSPYERLRIDRKHSRLQFLRTYEAARRTAGGKNNANTQTKLN